ncbi:MAG: PKD domain-containing protein, partial [Thermoplasmatota archaeon]
NWAHTENATVTVEDNDPPSITDYSGKTTGDVNVGTGNTVMLWVTGEDNIAVTEATVTIDDDDYDMDYNASTGRWEYLYEAPSNDDADLYLSFTLADAAGYTDTTGAVTLINVTDDDAPTINTPGDTTGTTGDTKTITATLSDNIGVATATLYYRTASATSWNSASILGGSVAINIPSDSTETWYYYVVANDAADNGPVGDPSTDGSSYYTITITDNDAPTVSLSGPSGTIETSSVTYSWSTSDNIGVDTVSYKLNGYDSSWITTSDSSKSYTDLADGSYTFQVRATDAAGKSTISSKSFTVDTNTPPTASFTYSPSGPTDLDAISFTSTSTDTDGDIVNYTWSFGDGTKAYGATATHAYEDNATYTVKLTVEDDKGDTDTETKQITVANEPPTAVIRTEPAEKAGIDEEILFNSTLSSDEDGTIASYAWDFGDGNTSTLANPTHAYEEGGDYTVTLTVTDNDGDTGTTTVTLTVEEDQPDYLLPILAIIILVVIAIIVVLVWRRRSMGSE